MNFKDLIDEFTLNGINSFTVSIEPDSNTLADGYFVKIGSDTYLVGSDGNLTFMEEIDPETGDYVGESLSTDETLIILHNAGVRL